MKTLRGLGRKREALTMFEFYPIDNFASLPQGAPAARRLVGRAMLSARLDKPAKIARASDAESE